MKMTCYNCGNVSNQLFMSDAPEIDLSATEYVCSNCGATNYFPTNDMIVFADGSWDFLKDIPSSELMAIRTIIHEPTTNQISIDEILKRISEVTTPETLGHFRKVWLLFQHENTPKYLEAIAQVINAFLSLK